MCGRYSIAVDKNTIEYHFDATFVSGAHEFQPTYNAAPSQLLPIITTYAPSAINLAKWGFVPEGWASSRIRPQNNARLETAAEKTMFRSSFSGRHCMVLTDGFHEWHTDPKIGHKQPYRFVMKSGEPFAMAGIYARGEDERAPLTFAILTANERHAPRPRSHAGYLATRPREQWLPTTLSGTQVFAPFPAELMTAYPVTPNMNNTGFNEPEAIAPLKSP